MTKSVPTSGMWLEMRCLILLSDSSQVSFSDSGIPSKHKLFSLGRFSRLSSLFPRSSSVNSRLDLTLCTSLIKMSILVFTRIHVGTKKHF